MRVRKDKVLLALMLLALLAVAAFALRQEHHAAQPFELQCAAKGRTERIALWEDEAGSLYAFLPSWADPAATTIHLLTDQPVQVNGMVLTEGMTCAQWAEGEPLRLDYRRFGKTEQCAFQLLRSANIPAMHIDTASGSMAYIHEKKTNEESAQLRLYTPEGSVDFAGKIDKIKGRGNNTWEAFDKKPYSLTLAQEADLLGLGTAGNWVLLADAGDPSHLRNRLAFDLAGNLGMLYTPESVWVDVYLNGVYAGVYLLAERIEIHPERVDVSAGSVLLSMDHESRLQKKQDPYLKTAADQAFRIHGPEITDNEAEYLAVEWQRVEDALLADDAKWAALLDLESWVKAYLVNEVLGNSDANYLSQYFVWVRDESERVYAGPVWDFDHAMGQRGAWQRMEPQRFFANQLLAIDNHETPWFHAAYQKDDFFARMTEVYAQQLLPALDSLLNSELSVYCTMLEQAVRMDQLRWQVADSLEAEASYIRQYMLERIAFLNSVWLEERDYCQVRADQGFGAAYGYFAVPVGERLNRLPELNDTDTQVFLGWYDVETGEPFHDAEPLYDDAAVEARWQDKPGKKLGTIQKLIPAAIFGFVLMLLVAAHALRIRRDG